MRPACVPSLAFRAGQRLRISSWRRIVPGAWTFRRGFWAISPWRSTIRAARRLMLIHDALGIRPLYYHWDGHRCLVSDDQERLLADPAIPDALNPLIVAEWCLHNRVHHPTETFFQGIRKVPHASYRVVDTTGVHGRRYWSHDTVAPLDEGTEAEHVAHLRRLLRQVVEDRLDPSAPIGAHASGGLDSTPIALLVAEAAGRRGQTCNSFNWCRPDPDSDPEHYEWAVAREAARQHGLRHHEIGVSVAGLTESLLQHDLTVDGTTTFEYELAARDAYRQSGIRQLFSGFGGDEYLTTRTRDLHRGACRQGHWLSVWRHLRMEEPIDAPLWRLGLQFGRRLTGQGRSPNAAVNTATGMARRTRNRTLIHPELQPWLREDSPVDRYFRSGSIREQQALMFELGYHRERLEGWAIIGRRLGLRYVFPLLDRRIVEFAHALPIAWFYRQGGNRYLYRQALRGQVPDTLLVARKRPELQRVAQLSRASQPALISDAVLDHIAACPSDFVNTVELRRRCQNLRQTEGTHLTDGERKLEIKSLFNAVLTLNLGLRRRGD